MVCLVPMLAIVNGFRARDMRTRLGICKGLIYLFMETENCFMQSNSCKKLIQTRDLFLEPIHKRQLIQSQVARLTLFIYSNFNFNCDRPTIIIQIKAITSLNCFNSHNCNSELRIHVIYGSGVIVIEALMFWN